MYEITHLPSIIEAGVTGEKGMRRIQIDMRPWLVDMPDGVASMVLIRPGETSSNAYIAATTFADGILTWSPALADLGEVEGYGQMEIWLEKTQNSSVVKRGKSAKVQTFIRQSIADETGPIPEAQESWLEQMTALKTQTVNAAASVEGVVEDVQEAVADAEAAKEAAEAAASAAMSAAVAAPEIRNGTWWIFNTVTSEWEDTEVSATGPAGPTGSAGPKGDPGDDGVTPEITVTDITGGHRVAITDGSGTETFDVMDGAKGETGNTGATGATPNLTIGTVSTLNPGQSATATITGTAENPVLNMGIPKGQTGDDGVSPEITVTDITGGHRVAVTDGSGTETFDVMDGSKGETGNTGATGATPNLTIGTVTTLNPDQSATATITGTPENPVLNMGIPRGQTGSVQNVYSTTIPISESDSRNIKQVLDLKLESVPVMEGATASADGEAGLVPAPETGDEDKVLKGDGTWGTIVTDPMTGATASTDGAAGLVPAPEAGDQDKVLKGSGTWEAIPTMTGATSSADGASGLVPVPEAGDDGKYLKGDGTWEVPQKRTNSEIVDLVYPVGSIYMSVAATSPATLFGGTWEKLKDRFLLGSGDTYTAGNTGGAASQSYTPAGTVGSHTLTTTEIPSHSHGLNSHTHSVGAHSHGLNEHVHSVGAHAHGLNSHTHSIPALSGSAASNGRHSHPVRYAGQTDQLEAKDGTVQTPVTANWSRGVGVWTTTEPVVWADNDGAHTHTVSTTASTTGQATGNTANSSAFNTGKATGSTANSTAFNTGAASGNTESAGGGGGHSHGFTGTAATISTMPPYLVVNMWKRTA